MCVCVFMYVCLSVCDVCPRLLSCCACACSYSERTGDSHEARFAVQSRDSQMSRDVAVKYINRSSTSTWILSRARTRCRESRKRLRLLVLLRPPWLPAMRGFMRTRYAKGERANNTHTFDVITVSPLYAMQRGSSFVGADSVYRFQASVRLCKILYKMSIDAAARGHALALESPLQSGSFAGKSARLVHAKETSRWQLKCRRRRRRRWANAATATFCGRLRNVWACMYARASAASATTHGRIGRKANRMRNNQPAMAMQSNTHTRAQNIRRFDAYRLNGRPPYAMRTVSVCSYICEYVCAQAPVVPLLLLRWFRIIGCGAQTSFWNHEQRSGVRLLIHKTYKTHKHKVFCCANVRATCCCCRRNESNDGDDAMRCAMMVTTSARQQQPRCNVVASA